MHLTMHTVDHKNSGEIQTSKAPPQSFLKSDSYALNIRGN